MVFLDVNIPVVNLNRSMTGRCHYNLTWYTHHGPSGDTRMPEVMDVKVNYAVSFFRQFKRSADTYDRLPRPGKDSGLTPCSWTV